MPARRILVSLLAGIFLSLLSRQSLGLDLYVNNISGDDTRDGQSAEPVAGQDGPVRSIGRALDLAKAGDHIHLFDTGIPYREEVSLHSTRHCGTAISDFVLDGHGATLDGSKEITPQAWESADKNVFRYQPRWKSHQNLFRDGIPLTHVQLAAGDSLQKLEPLQWTFDRGAIYFRPEKGRLPSDYNLSCCDLWTGITLYHVHDVMVMNLTIQGYQVDGIQAKDRVIRGEIAGVVCRGNGRAGVNVEGASEVVVSESLLGDNRTCQLRAEKPALVILETTELPETTAPDILNRDARIFVDRSEKK